MFDLLDKYLRNNVPDEHYALFERTLEILEKFQIRDFEDYATPMIQDDVDGVVNPGEAMTGLHNLAMQYLGALVSELHQIKFNPEATHAQLNELADALYMLQDYEDRQGLIEILHTDMNNSDMLCMILGRVSSYDYAQWINIVWGCSDDFLARLTEVTSASLESAASAKEREELDAVAKRLKDYCAFLQVKRIMATIKVGFGTPMLQPIDYYLADIRETIRTVPANTAAIELFGFALLSHRKQEDILTCYADKWLDIFDDLQTIKLVERTYRNIFDRFTIFEQQSYDSSKLQG